MTQEYRGRFAPSPTGPLHFGSLVTAVASYLEAKSHHGKWLIRIDDLDTPRCIEGMDKHILDTLEQFGLFWDEDIVYQGKSRHLYEEALEVLTQDKLVYPCGCTRKEIATIAKTGAEGPIYPGTCRNGLPKGKTKRSTRYRAPMDNIKVHDRIQASIKQNPAIDIGDFIVKRADGLFAYQLAVVVDDYQQSITDIVRGSDLIESTPRQVCLQQALGYPVPGYAHIPVATNAEGRKLSKQTFAREVDSRQPAPALVEALKFLNQDIEDGLETADLESFWQSATKNWDMAKIPSTSSIPLHNKDYY